MISRRDVDGLVLAGGASRRMQGASERGGDEPRAGEQIVGASGGGRPIDKGLLMLEGAPLAQWVARFLAPWVDTVYISANRNHEAYGRYGRCVADDPEFGGDAGPLAGVASVMARSRRPWLLVSPVDVPRLPADMPARLIEAVAGGAPLAYACAGSKAHPLCMLLRRDSMGDLRSYLLGGGRKVLDWHRRQGGVPVDFGDDPALFRNINAPGDWFEAGGGRSEFLSG